mgnify:CR=1 FL=1
MRNLPANVISCRSRTCPFTRFSCVYPCFNLKQARMSIGVSDEQIDGLLNVARSTWWRYRQGHQKPSRAVCAYLHILVGHLPWTGWKNCFVNLREQKLYIDDYQFGLSLRDLRVYWWQVRELRALRREKKQAQSEARRAPTRVFPMENVA